MNNTYNLFLDDLRFPKHCISYSTMYMPADRVSVYLKQHWRIVRNFEEFVREVENSFAAGEIPDIVSFDHDLADAHYMHYDQYPVSFDEKSGHDCAKWFMEFCTKNDVPAPRMYIHSMNTVGAKRIYETLESWK